MYYSLENVYLDNRFFLAKEYDCACHNHDVHSTVFIIDKKALPYIKNLIDKESNNSVKSHMEDIYCLQLYDLERYETGTNEDKYYNQAMLKITNELDKHGQNGYICYEKPLWYRALLVKRKDDKEVISVSKKFRHVITSLYEAYFDIARDGYKRDTLELTFEESCDIEKAFKQLVEYGLCFYNEAVEKILKSNGIKFTKKIIESTKSYFSKRLLVLRKKLNAVMNKTKLVMMQALPLELKIRRSLLVIQQWYDYWGGQVYISLSGGKDSSVLAWLVRQLYPDVPVVFCNTGLEHPLVREHAMSYDNLVVIRPEMPFPKVVKHYGYPIITKSQAMAIRKLTTQDLSIAYRNKLLYGDERGKMGCLSKKWHYLLDAPFKVSEKCCDVMKKKPFKAYEAKTGRKPFIGTLAVESPNRETEYLKTGCNAFDEDGKVKSTPLGFWTEQDILRCIKDYNIPISPAYGDIVEVNGQLTTTKEKRTGCLFCGFGVHLEPPGNNRFQRLAIEYPQLHKYCMEKLELDVVLNYIGVDFYPVEETHKLIKAAG
jgi:3'-phosphoadenosine 5'-phosphosulfate sulfotransferase (PAPS reductase)/FAD synthetase